MTQKFHFYGHRNWKQSIKERFAHLIFIVFTIAKRWKQPKVHQLTKILTYTNYGISLSLYFFKYKFIYFNWRLITLQYCIVKALQYCIVLYGFAIHWHESATGILVFPTLSPSPLLPPHPIPLGHPRAPAPSTTYHASNLDWWFISHMIIYMFQCHFPTLSHSHPLLQSPKRLFYTSVSLLLSRIQGYCYHLSKFHIYVSILYWCFSFWLTSLCIIGSR